MNVTATSALFAGLAPGTRVVAAMSGGVDSAVAAALAHAAGLDVVGVTLNLAEYPSDAPQGARTCCAGRDVYDARRAADTIGIPHYVFDWSERFRAEVIAPFAAAYAAGETPVPCVACNRTVKFRDLLGLARELDAAALVTGHYARRLEGPDGPELHRAVDAARDQSWFLFATTRAQLAALRLPLGGFEKTAVRGMARAFGLPLADKPDSQDICFVPDGRYADLVERLRPEAGEPGDIVDLAGRVLGRHRGIGRYTIGQRRGLGIGAAEEGAEPLYVVRLDAAGRRVVVGPRRALAIDRIAVREVNWLGGGAAPPADGMGVTVRLRSAMAPVAATMARDDADGAVVMLGAPEYGIAAGQAAVFHDGPRVLGGGFIAATGGVAARAA
ncbi:MAG: tRNA 2-thiouridine(34) synthase MnmA [Alphaproteobacteria bacterium]|nr:tRNA 2-thiouridine(34) synthase MnmA [Alphaproteobacteria bacterium]